MAKNNVKEKIKKYFTEACKEAGGKPSNSRCKFEIYYYAKSPDGKHSKVGGPKTLYAGQTLTCTYSDFQLSESDLQYELEMDAATKGALINSGIQMGMGVLNGGIKIFQASKTKKELETAEKGSAGCYKFDGNSLEKDDGDNGCNGKSKLCSGKEYYQKNGFCYHKFENDVTKIERQEKTAELIRSKVNLSKLKYLAGLEERRDYLENMNAQAAFYEKVNNSDNKTKTFLDDQIANLNKEIENANTNTDKDSYSSKFSNAMSAYNTNQGKLNENKEALENAGKDLQSGISDLTGGVLGGGTQMITTLMTAKENKGTMTGACYLGDPKNGGTLFASEGETKKISWK